MKSFRLKRQHEDVSVGPHPKGSPLVAKEKACILNLYQSYVNDGMSNQQARQETARRLQFCEESVLSTIKEMLSEGNVINNTPVKMTSNAYEKLSDEEVHEINMI